MTTFKNNIQRVNNSNSIVYDGDVYVEKDSGLGTTVKALSDRKHGERSGYIEEDGERIAAINEKNGWLLEGGINFDFYFNDYIMSHASLDKLTNEVAVQKCGIRPDDNSEWANELRTVIREFIWHFDHYLEDDAYLDEKDFGDPNKLNKVFSDIILDGIVRFINIYDIAEDIRAFKPYVNVTATENKGGVAKKTASYIVAALVVAGMGVVLFSLICVGVFLLPLIGGAFTAK